MSDHIVNVPPIDELKKIPLEDIKKHYFKADYYKGTMEAIKYILTLKNKIENEKSN